MSQIEWTESTWNPVVGCAKVSSGCANCYAERMAFRLAAMSRAAIRDGRNPGRMRGYSKVINRNGRWNGRVYLDYAALDEPKRWRMPRTIFVNSMSDLFHPDVPDDFIYQLLDTTTLTPQHTYQILTKRPERAALMSQVIAWPENVWLGTSVENSQVIHRVRHLTRINAFVRFLSIEPLLGPLGDLDLAYVDWVIVGGESGPGARPMKVEWVRFIRDQCLASDIPFFFKQWGGIQKKRNGRLLDGQTWDQMPISKGAITNEVGP